MCLQALADGKCVVYIANASTVHAAHVQLPLQASVETGKEGVLVATPAQVCVSMRTAHAA